MILINKWSRPGTTLHATESLIIHWPHMKGKSAFDVYNYFGNTVIKEQRHASTQWAIGLQGELLELMNEYEVAYHVGTTTKDPASGKIYTDLARELFGKYAIDRSLSPNLVTVGIEVCHLDNKGTMTEKTVEELVKFAASFCIRHNLDPRTRVLRHFDVVGWKDCPRYWVRNPIEWDNFLQRVFEKYKEIQCQSNTGSNGSCSPLQPR